MKGSETQWRGLATISELIESSGSNQPGRTAIMKYLYLLKTLRKVPLDYHFRLYTYGPFDSHVLDDLKYAETLDAVKSDLFEYQFGRGYRFRSGSESAALRARAEDFLEECRDDIEWVVKEFGDRSASELETLSTIVYVDREQNEPASVEEIAAKVHEVKPHIAKNIIEGEVKKLKAKALLEHVN